MTRLPLLIVALATVALTSPASAQAVCPCASYGPYPCDAALLVALPDQVEPLQLTEVQLTELLRLRDAHLRDVHELLGDIAALHEAVHDLERPYESAEVFALFYDLGRHHADLEAAFREASEVLLSVLEDGQRARWTALVVQAAALQESAPECAGDPTP
ncbi:hypothetical protein [Rubrivirga sp.]|uniref:hypothetical protein n=1 Tax=Rubrivirga sp. TaxID=1885344 RepID=UPI003C7356EB